MPTFSFTTTIIVDNELSAPSKINSKFEEIAYWLNSLKLDADNIQDGSIEGKHFASSIVDDETLEYDSANKNIKVKRGGIDRNMLSSLGQVESAASTTFTTSITTFQTVTDGSDPISVSLVTIGRPVVIMVKEGTLECSRAGATANGAVKLLNDSSDVGSEIRIGVGSDSADTNAEIVYPGSSFIWFDTPSAGTQTYTIQIRSRTAGTTVTARTIKLLAWELF